MPLLWLCGHRPFFRDRGILAGRFSTRKEMLSASSLEGCHYHSGGSLFDSIAMSSIPN
jgi:hypothetical protein